MGAKGARSGVFRCSCGYVYTRTITNGATGEAVCRARVLAFGPVWEKELRRLWLDSSMSLRGIARRLQVDPSTVKRMARRMDLPYPRAGMKTVSDDAPVKADRTALDRREQYRTAWLQARSENPQATRSQLRQRLLAIYNWLRRYDREWFEANSPKAYITARTRHSRVNWPARDAALSESVVVAADRIRGRPGRPVRLTLTAIANEIGYPSMLRHHNLRRLPKTAEVLRKLVESRDAFAVRKREWELRCLGEMDTELK